MIEPMNTVDTVRKEVMREINKLTTKRMLDACTYPYIINTVNTADVVEVVTNVLDKYDIPNQQILLDKIKVSHVQDSISIKLPKELL